jgi:hypothetical protein
MASSIADYVVPAASRHYLKVPITSALPVVNDDVSFAFVQPAAAPGDSDWLSGNWEAGTPPYARCLIGPGGTIALAHGLYDVFVRITDDPEIPVLNVGLLEVTP